MINDATKTRKIQSNIISYSVSKFPSYHIVLLLSNGFLNFTFTYTS